MGAHIRDRTSKQDRGTKERRASARVKWFVRYKGRGQRLPEEMRVLGDQDVRYLDAQSLQPLEREAR
jgi:hypothetical protein